MKQLLRPTPIFLCALLTLFINGGASLAETTTNRFAASSMQMESLLLQLKISNIVPDLPPSGETREKTVVANTGVVVLMHNLGLQGGDKVLALSWNRSLDLKKVPAEHTEHVSIELTRDGKKQTLEKDILVVRSSNFYDGASTSSTSDSLAPEGPPQDITVPVSAADLKKWHEDSTHLLTQMRGVPYFKMGKSVGLRVFAIRSGSAYDVLGFKNGDIITKIGPQEITSPTQVVEVTTYILQDEKPVVELLRGNSLIRLHFEVKR